MMIGGDWRFKPRLSLRGVFASVAVVAPVLVAISPAVRVQLRERARRVRVMADQVIHLGEGRAVAERFVRAIRSGRRGEADALRTVALMETPRRGGIDPLGVGDFRLIEGFVSYSEEQGRLVSEYKFRCSGEACPCAEVVLFLVTESGHLKVDRVSSSGIAPAAKP